MSSAEKSPFETGTPALVEAANERIHTLILASQLVDAAVGALPAQPPTVEGQLGDGSVNQ